MNGLDFAVPVAIGDGLFIFESYLEKIFLTFYSFPIPYV